MGYFIQNIIIRHCFAHLFDCQFLLQILPHNHLTDKVHHLQIVPSLESSHFHPHNHRLPLLLQHIILHHQVYQFI